MSLERRTFLKNLLAGSALVSAGTSLSLSNAFAAGTSNRFFVFCNANGGWDTTMFCDPKGDEVLYSESRGVINKYKSADIKRAGKLPYAPLSPGIDDHDTDWIQTFMKRHYKRMTVFNGVSQETNSHTIGKRYSATGSSDQSVPATGALIAAPYGKTQPMAFYRGNYTRGVIPAANLDRLDVAKRLANPNPYLPDAVFERLHDSQNSELQQLMANAESEQQALEMQLLADARSSSGRIGELLNYLPETTSSGSKLTAEIAAASFAAGLATCAHIGTGGFDTHNDHDRRQYNALQGYLSTIDHLWSELERLGIADKTTIIFGGDFGRTPYYNDRAGKDHWNVSSVVAMGAGIPGNRVIGATNDQYKVRRINPNTLELDDKGLVLTRGHIHKAIRRMAGIRAGDPLDNRYPIVAEELNLFGA